MKEGRKMKEGSKEDEGRKEGTNEPKKGVSSISVLNITT